MSQIGFRGFPTGQTVTLGASAGGVTAPAASATWPDETLPSTDALVFVQNVVINPAVLPATATVESALHNGSYWRTEDGGFEPLTFRTRFTAASGGANVVPLTLSAATQADSWREGALDGATAHVWRIESGVPVLKRSSAVTAHRASGWVRQHGDKVITATSFGKKFATFNRPSASQWFAVAAVDATGVRGTYATGTYTTPAAFTSPANPSNTFSASLDDATTTGAALAAPANLTLTPSEGGTIVTLSWDAVSGASGYVVLMSDYDPADHAGFGLDLASDGGPAVVAGDMVIVHKKFTTVPTRAEALSNRVWNVNAQYSKFFHNMINGDNNQPIFPGEDADLTYSLVPHDAQTPVEEPGETFLRVVVGSGKQARIGTYNHSHKEQIFYEVLDPTKTYRLEFWAKAASAATVTFYPKIRDATGVDQNITNDFSITTSWQKFSWDFSPAVSYDTGLQTSFMYLSLDGANTFDLDNFRVYDTAGPYHLPTPSKTAQLQALNLSALRDHNTVKTYQRTYDLDSYTNPTGVTSNTRASGSTLRTLLDCCVAVGADPWLQVEPHFTPTEWLGLIEYLAAPSGGYADKRIAHGRTAPWTGQFDKIYFELGNETWNGLFAPWTYDSMTDGVTAEVYSGGTVYGKFMEYVIGLFKSSPHWTTALESKFVFVLGGWAGQLGFTRDCAAASPSSHIISIAAYNGGWEAGGAVPDPDVPDSYRRTLDYVVQGADRNLSTLITAADGKDIGTYEAGPGYLINGLNGATVTDQDVQDQERVMKSVAAGISTLDTFLLYWSRGMVVQNFFTINEGGFYNGSTKWWRNNEPTPSLRYLGLFNTEAGGGDMLKCEAITLPRSNIPAYMNGENVVYAAVSNAPKLAAYAFRRGDRLAVFLINRNLPWSSLDSGDPLYLADDDGSVTVHLRLPIQSATSMSLKRLNASYEKQNFALAGSEATAASIDVETVALSLPAVVNSQTVTVPAAQAYLYIFEGVT